MSNRSQANWSGRVVPLDTRKQTLRSGPFIATRRMSLRKQANDIKALSQLTFIPKLDSDFCALDRPVYQARGVMFSVPCVHALLSHSPTSLPKISSMSCGGL